eukprot:3288819-Pyramimonas_sp.AAC.1
MSLDTIFRLMPVKHVYYLCFFFVCIISSLVPAGSAARGAQPRPCHPRKIRTIHLQAPDWRRAAAPWLLSG